MAFQGQGGQELQNRRILQDIQQKRQMLLNQGQSGGGLTGANSSVSRLVAVPESSSSLPNKPHEMPIIRNPSDMSSSQRQTLEHANATSSGYFISQDSAYGNLILPVIPRFDNEQ